MRTADGTTRTCHQRLHLERIKAAGLDRPYHLQGGGDVIDASGLADAGTGSAGVFVDRALASHTDREGMSWRC